MKLIIIVLCFHAWFTIQNAQGQTGSTLSGKIVELSTNEPMEFVNVTLFYTNDSSFANSVVTDKNGVYVFHSVPEGNYFLQISFLGFETINTPGFPIIAGSQINKELIAIKAISHVLNDVVVSGQKSVIQSSIDKKIYNVGKDIISSSSSASQVLENVPSVSVSIDGVVSLRGSENVTILVNGRPSAIMRMNSATALQQIPASTIDRIEIITNPSAKYKPDGTAGIINIVLKKEVKDGINGTLTANIGNDDRYNDALTFNYKPGKLNFYGSYSYRHDTRLRSSTDFRIVRDSKSNLISTYDYFNAAHYSPQSYPANLGIDYFMDNKNEMGISANYFYFSFLRMENASTIIHDKNDQVTSDFDRFRLDDEYEYDKELSTYYDHKFKKEDHNLRFDFNINDHFEQEDNKFTEFYRVPSLEDAKNNTLIRQWERSGEASLEYVNPINEDTELQAGYTEEWFNEDFDFYGEYFDKHQNAWIKDVEKSNLFSYRQTVHVAYATYSQSFGDIGLKLGLRGEDAIVISNLVTLDSMVKQDYLKLYPTIHVSYELNDKAQFQLSYSKRINRPEGDELNPFPEYADPRNLKAGNPFLKPEEIHSIEFGYQFKNDLLSFVPSLYYRYKYNSFTEVKHSINDSTLLTTSENLSNSQSAGLELILSWKFEKLMTMNFSSNIYYNEIDATNLGYSDKRSAIAGNLKVGVNINLSNSTVMQLNTNYRFPELTPQGKNLPGYAINAGLRQDVFGNKAAILLTVSDVFNTLRWKSEIDTPELFQTTTSKRKSQIVYLGFTYRIGKINKKTVDELKFDEQK